MMSDNDKPRTTQEDAKLNMHKMFLEALRHREQDIIRFLAILGPSLGGFIWLLGDVTHNPARFVAGTYGVLLVLVLGAFYSLALGYNYRYLTLQLAKLESQPELNLECVMLASWPHQPAEFQKRNRWGVIPWCTPPGIIKVFWIAFLACIAGVTIMARYVEIELPTRPPNAAATQPTTQALVAQQQAEKMETFKAAIPWVGGACFALALLWPVTIGRKMLKACRDEDPKDWKARSGKTDASAGSNP